MSLNKRLIGTGAGASLSLSIGDFVGGGVVFYVDPNDDTKGLVMDIVDGGGRYSNSNTNVSTGAGIGSGALNTYNAKTVNGENSAPWSCWGFVRRGFNDWYLPSRYENQELFSNLSITNAACIANGGAAIDSNRYYISSTQNTTTTVWGNSGTGGSLSIGKYNSENHRAIRSVNKFTRENSNGSINYGHYQGSPTGGNSTITIYAQDGTDWIQLFSSTKNASQSTGWRDYVWAKNIPLNTPLKITASYGYYYYSDYYGIRVYKNIDGSNPIYGNTIVNAVLSNEGTDTFVDVGSNYRAYRYSQGNFGGYTAVMYCTLT